MDVEWEREFHSESADAEGHSSCLSDDGLLVCGCSEGHATDDGGYDWKAHLLKLSGAGEVVWQRALRIRGNECAYNVIACKNILLFGETKDDKGSGLFIECLDSEGNTVWNKQYGNWRNLMAGGIVASGQGIIFSGNVTTEEAQLNKIFSVGPGGETLWEKEMPGYFIFQMCKLDDGFLLTGEQSGKILLAKMNDSGNLLWESIFREGTGISLLDMGQDIILGGMDSKGNPVLMHVDSHGNLVKEFNIGGAGGIEAMALSGRMLLAAIHSFEPREFTELVMVDL